MKRFLGAALAALLAASPAFGGGFVLRPGPGAVAGKAAAAIPPATTVDAWSASLTDFLRSPSPDIGSVRAAAFELAALNPGDPRAQAALAPLAAALEAGLSGLLAAPDPAAATESSLAAAQLKFKVLNFPAVRAWLPEGSRNAVGAAAWAYNEVLWDRKDRDVDAAASAIAQGLSSSKGSSFLDELPAPRSGPDVSVEVLSGDITKVAADALIATVDETGTCRGGLHSAIESAGGACHREAIERALPLSEGQVVLSKPLGGKKTPFGGVLFLSDRRERPLELVVRDALAEADAAGLKSVSLPALRTGSVFGAIERSYDDVAQGLRRGVALFLAQARSSLERVSFVVQGDDGLAGKIQAALAGSDAVQRERSLRIDLRAARLSGAGYELSARPAVVSKRSSPIYGSLLKPWDLSHLLKSHKPVAIGAIEDRAAFSAPTPSVLNMPIKMPGGGFKVPEELAQFREFLQKIIDHEAAVNPRMDEFYAYLTVDQNDVRAGATQRRPGVHIDGVQGARYAVKLPPEHLYSVSDSLGTVFYDQSFDLTWIDPARQHVHAELERQAKEENAVRAPDYEIEFWDSYSVHRADAATRPLRRTFVRVEFSRKKYDSLGDTHNPLFDYDWAPVARPIPAELDDSPRAATKGFSAELVALRPGEPHTVKDLDAYLQDNLGEETLLAARQGARFLIAVGEGRQGLERISGLGWRVGARIGKREGYHRVFEAKDPQGRAGFVIQRVNGEDRVLHVQSLLKLAGVSDDRVETSGKTVNWREHYRRVFDAMGYVPDLVVYGFANTTIDAALLRNAFKNGRHFATLRRNYAAKKDAISGAEEGHDLDGMTMQVLELADGRRMWLLHCMFGDLARDLVGAAVDHGAKNVAFIGSVGSLESAARMGEIVVPAAYRKSDGSVEKLDRISDIAGLSRRGVYERIATPNLGTGAWTAQARARGTDLIDSELGYILDELAVRPDVRLHVALVIAEAVFGPDGRDMTEWGLADLRKLIPDLGRVLDASLPAKTEDYVMKKFMSVPLSAPARKRP